MLREWQLVVVVVGVMLVLILVLVACTHASSTNVALTATAQSAAVPPGDDFRLPAPLYFLREGRIMRLSRDAETLEQVGSETTTVVDLDVSPVDGALVYLTDNHLMYADGDGGNRRVLVSGPQLPAVDNHLASLNDRDHISGRIAGPRWSPDGDHIAYVQNGLNVISVSSGEVETVSPNDRIPEQGEKTSLDPLVYADVIAWSPDGAHILVEVYGYPLASMADRTPAIVTLGGDRTIVWDCGSCNYAWSADSREVYVTHPSRGGGEGILRFDLEGGQGQYLAQYVPARTSYYYAYPHPLSQHEMYYFMGSGPDDGELPAAFKLYRGPTRSLAAPTTLRDEDWSIEAALWARDGSGVLIAASSASDGISTDTLVWLPVDGSPITMLPVTGARTLRWGGDG